LWLYAFAAVTWKGFFIATVDYPAHWKGWARPVVVLLTCVALLLLGGAVYVVLIDVDEAGTHIAAIAPAIRMARGEPTDLPFAVPESAESAGDVLTLFSAAIFVILRQYVMLAFLLFCLGCVAAATVGPYLLLLVTWGVLFIGSLMLKWLHPVIAIVLERVYQSEKGVLTQVGIAIAAVVKIVDEAIRRF
jgi:hypothetical protein